MGRDFASHRFAITLENPVDAGAAAEWLRQRAAEACSAFLAEARAQRRRTERRLGVTLGGVEPAVTLATTEIGKIQFQVALFYPAAKAVELEQEMIADFLARLHDGRMPDGNAQDAQPVAIRGEPFRWPGGWSTVVE